MAIKLEARHTMKLLYTLSWIIFVGVCVEAGGILFNSVDTLLVHPAGDENRWQGTVLSGLYQHDTGYFAVGTLIMSTVAVLKGVIFYLIVKVLHDKKLDLLQPFNTDMQRFISRISRLALVTGLFSFYGNSYVGWLVNQGADMPDAQHSGLGGGDVWLFMSAILFVVGHIFKRGIEIQTENELTI